ncbi:MAG: potassium/proton antiporter [Gaiellaceae bacterium]
MHELTSYGYVVLAVAGGLTLAIWLGKLMERLPVPVPAILLLAAAGISELSNGVARHATILTVERIAVVALIVILFDGGMRTGWRRFRTGWVPISALGILGTFGTAALMAVVARLGLGLGWTTAGLLGAALAPTDPAVMFSVFGRREVRGRSATILEGESGANDPVGIALMIGMISFATSDHGSLWIVVREFSLEMAVGLAVGVVGARLLLPLMRVSLHSPGLHPVRALAGAGTIYAVASIAHGSGFLAVFVAGILLGDEQLPFRRSIESVLNASASLAEIGVFVALGLTVDLGYVFSHWRWLQGLILAAVLGFVVRPLVVTPLLMPMRMRWRERAFIAFGGLKGAVPILLAAFAVLGGVADAQRIYALVFVVVAFSVLVQGTLIPTVAARLRLPMREIEHPPWSISMPVGSAPDRVMRVAVHAGSAAEGRKIRELPLESNAWVSLIVREGSPLEARGATELCAEDELLLLVRPGQEDVARRLFEASA